MGHAPSGHGSGGHAPIGPRGVGPAARSHLLTHGVRGDTGECDEALGEALLAVDPARTGEVVAEGGMGEPEGWGPVKGMGSQVGPIVPNSHPLKNYSPNPF
jgi:hypothetical protein